MLSVVLPSYNEEKMIPIATERLGEILSGAGIDYELLFVDDGSRDGTWREILCASSADPHVVGVHFSRNFGKEAAMFAGLESSPRPRFAHEAEPQVAPIAYGPAADTQVESPGPTIEHPGDKAGLAYGMSGAELPPARNRRAGRRKGGG